jgi:ABC-type antimicrobial peptide transport system permease subunit
LGKGRLGNFEISISQFSNSKISKLKFMFRNYLKIAWRNLWRNKGFSITNILGLTIGITCTILILLWVQDELNYDKFNTNYDNIYQVMANRDFNNEKFTDPNMVMPLAQSIQAQVPQVKNAVLTTYRAPHVITYGDTKLKQSGYTVSDNFFKVFTVKFIEGSAATAIPDAYSIVLSQTAAKALFGNEEALNKVVKIDNNYNAKVTAIVADMPGNSTLQFDFVNLFNYSGDYEKQAMTNWQNCSWMVYIQTLPGADIQTIEKKINDIKYQHDPIDKNISKYFAFPMRDWHLRSDFKDGKNVGGMIEYVRMFAIIACIILLIACVNFMNFSTARSEKRAKEVGVRKTLGSDRKQLVLQFYFEAMILTLIAFALSLITVLLLLPSFNTLVDKHLLLPFDQPTFWLAALLIIIFTGIIAGSYPALYLSSFNAVKVLKGTFKPGKNATLPRRILVVAQFVISILLISSTIIVYQQIQHIRDRDMGYDPNNLVMIPSSDDISKNYTVIKEKLLKTGMINAVTRTLSPITQIWWKSQGPDYNGKPANQNMIFNGMGADLDFTKTMGIKMLQGNDFSGTPADTGYVLLNKAAITAMGLKNPIGMQMRYNNGVYTVRGVMDDVIMESPFKPVDPLMVYFRPGGTQYVTIRLNNNASPKSVLAAIQNIFTAYNPSEPFEYQFVDAEYGKKFITEDLIRKLSNIFAALAIFICCIGLAGLASFTIEKRIKEIGIRKVLGASVQQLLLLISKEFLRLVLIAFVVAVPLTYWLMNNWLQKYAFRIDISVWMFAAVGCVVLLLTLIVVSLNTIGAAIANPVKSLRAE